MWGNDGVSLCVIGILPRDPPARVDPRGSAWRCVAARELAPSAKPRQCARLKPWERTQRHAHTHTVTPSSIEVCHLCAATPARITSAFEFTLPSLCRASLSLQPAGSLTVMRTSLALLVLVACWMASAASVAAMSPVSAYPTCGPASESRCLGLNSLRCNLTTTAPTPTDQQCCAGLTCVAFTVPPTETQPQQDTSICLDQGGAQPQPAGIPPAKTPPIMAPTWSANTTYYNMSDGSLGWGTFYYDSTLGPGAIRTDFFPNCPFVQLYESGLESNYQPCTVLFVGGQNYYIYPEIGICCNYTFPAWKPQWMCQGNSSYLGSPDIDGVQSDFWSVEWETNFNTPVQNIRDMYTVADTNIPLRFREDLDTGYMDFHDYYAGALDPAIFTDLISAFPCHQGHGHNGNTDKTCTHYNAQSLRREWPCDNPTCTPPPPLRGSDEDFSHREHHRKIIKDE